MSIVELCNIVKTKLITEAVRNTFGDMCENIFDFSFESISGKNPKTNHKELNRYFYTVYLLKLVEEGAQGTKILNTLRESQILLEILEDKIQALALLYDDILQNEILVCEKLEDLLEWVEISNSLKVYSETQLALSVAYNKFITLSHEEISNLSTSPLGKGYIDLLINIKKGLNYQIPLQQLAILTIRNSFNFIEQMNFFDYCGINIEKNPEQDWKIIEIIEDIMGTNNQDPNQQEIEYDFLNENLLQIKTSLESVLPYAEYKSKNGVFEGKNIDSYDTEIDFIIPFEDIIIEKRKTYSNPTNSFQVSIYKGRLKNDRNGVEINKTVGIKMYQEKKPRTDFTKISDEIIIYKRLSDLRKRPENCFTEYYGTCKNIENGKTTYYMIMEYQKKNLLKFLSENIELNDQVLFTMFKQLIRSFEQMHSLNIYHLDIKPANILIDQNFNMSIIDFDMAIMIKGNKTNASDKSERRAGTKGYADPKIQALIDGKNDIQPYSNAAADVFSLGMTFYHILVKNDFDGKLNTIERNDELLNKVKNLKQTWARDLLLDMLNKDENLRLSFKDLMGKFKCDSTKNYSDKNY
ncbi:hypothetical protein SteCoe_31583 [Stentor coeruleus]|uniref:Protein kinase domain-containing protein n=1 Tax=Stentor coeruleus TaxID=5963 RepID=A0A1R2B0X7_9CILI|nr:hypothetical protein SteCoe_31583 [Stentor coeruleus]